MNDLDICKRIAEIEGLDICDPEEWYYPEGCALILVDECSEEYNPLTDDALCFQLMVSHGVVVFHKYENDILICWAEHSDGSGAIGKPIFAPAGSDLQAVKQCACLAIIEANK